MSGHSKLRNRAIANVFNQMGLVEAWRTGIRRIKEAAKSYGLPSPEILVFDNMFRVNLYRSPMAEGQKDYDKASYKNQQSIGEASEKHRKRIRHGFPKTGYWEIKKDQVLLQEETAWTRNM